MEKMMNNTLEITPGYVAITTQEYKDLLLKSISKKECDYEELKMLRYRVVDLEKQLSVVGANLNQTCDRLYEEQKTNKRLVEKIASYNKKNIFRKLFTTYIS